jgi:hypothetical protein
MGHDSILEACPDYVSLRLPQAMEYAEAQKSLGVAGIERSVVDVIPALPGTCYQQLSIFRWMFVI